MVHIRFFAVRDPRESTLAHWKSVQDVTDIQSLLAKNGCWIGISKTVSRGER